jgi:hypothetical protein
MLVQRLRDSLVGLFTPSRRTEKSSKVDRVLSEQDRLIEKLKCIHLDEEEAKCLQGYLTTILEARYQENNAGGIVSDSSSCIVLEMAEEELQQFANVLGENGVRLFRAIVESNNTQTSSRKLAIVGEHGVRLFRVRVQSDSDRSSLQRN